MSDCFGKSRGSREHRRHPGTVQGTQEKAPFPVVLVAILFVVGAAGVVCAEVAGGRGEVDRSVGGCSSRRWTEAERETETIRRVLRREAVDDDALFLRSFIGTYGSHACNGLLSTLADAENYDATGPVTTFEELTSDLVAEIVLSAGQEGNARVHGLVAEALHETVNHRDGRSLSSSLLALSHRHGVIQSASDAVRVLSRVCEIVVDEACSE